MTAHITPSSCVPRSAQRGGPARGGQAGRRTEASHDPDAAGPRRDASATDGSHPPTLEPQATFLPAPPGTASSGWPMAGHRLSSQQPRSGCIASHCIVLRRARQGRARCFLHDAPAESSSRYGIRTPRPASGKLCALLTTPDRTGPAWPRRVRVTIPSDGPYVVRSR